MVILVVVLILILGGGGYFIYYYTTQNNTEVVASEPVIDTVVAALPMPEPDTMAVQIDTVVSTSVMDSTINYDFKMVIGNYKTRDRADKRSNSLTLNGNKVEVIMKDSASYLVLLPISCRTVDTTHVKDSLRRMFGYNEVVTFK
jgi:hypothetical protein